MSTLRCLPLLVLCSLTLLGAPARADNDDDRGYKRVRSTGGSESRIALVIGNSHYKSAPLKNPVRDAKLMAQSLTDVGFEVDARFDLNRNEMLRAIRDFGDTLRQSGGVGLFYFAGHGMQVNGRSYLIPVSADIRVEADVELEAVDAQRVLARMEEANNRLNLVVLDACRNNPVGRSVRSRESGLAFINAPSGTLISYATAPGRIAADGRGQHSYYTEALAQHLRTPGLRVEDVFKRVRSSVQEATRGEQTPWESSSLTGDFYFAGSATAVAPVPAPAPAPAPSAATSVPPRQDSSVVYGRTNDDDRRDEDLSYQGGDTQSLDEPDARDDDSYRREGRYRDYEGVSALEAQLAFHRTVVNYTEWLGYLGWSAAVAGFVLSLYGAVGFVVPTLIGSSAAVAALLLVFGVPLMCGGLVAGGALCGTAYLFRTFADGTVGEIKEKDPSWIDAGNNGCSPSMLF
jgi:uncharacterized caspase-like protein